MQHEPTDSGNASVLAFLSFWNWLLEWMRDTRLKTGEFLRAWQIMNETKMNNEHTDRVLSLYVLKEELIGICITDTYHVTYLSDSNIAYYNIII